MELVRTIHPIGQGAFYSEKFKTKDGHTINVVYDCGAGTASTISQPCQNIINGAFNPGEEIDILFISHFHADHINGISTLKNRCNIKKVVIPYIEEETRSKLKFLADHSPNFGAELSFIDPHGYFMNDQIVEIKGNNGDLNWEEEVYNIEHLSGQLNSGVLIELQTPNDFKWMYRPFCLPIKTSHLDTLDKLVQDWINNKDILKKDVLTDIQNTYKQINSDLNQTSMMVFSAPYDKEANNKYNHRLHPLYHCCRHCDVCEHDPLECHIQQRYGCVNRCIPMFPSCLYTGDIKLDGEVINLIQTATEQYTLGTFQIPHHGSSKSWSSSIFDTNCIRRCTQFFLSYGINNRYRHPNHKTLLEFGKNARVPYCVNENKNSVVIQRFYF